jgi:hypothetical protein
MSAQRLALVTLVLGLVAGVVVGSLVGPLLTPSTSGRALGVEGPLGLSPGDDGRARAFESVAALAPVAARSNEARSSVSSDVDESLARAVAERVSAAPALDIAASETGRDWTERITGVVVDEAGRPVSAATVTSDNMENSSSTLARAQSTAGVGRAWKGSGDLDESLVGSARWELARRRNMRTAVTDAAGRFVLEGVRPGNHYLRAYAEGLVFEPKGVFAGDSAHLIGRPVGEFHLDVRLPDGSTPAEAVVRLVDERRQDSYRWTPEEPVLRLEARVAQLQVLAGDVRSLDWRSFSSDYSSPNRTLDLARDGKGPHVFELTERCMLLITLEDLSTLEPRLPAWVKVISAEVANGAAPAQSFANSRRLTREPGELYRAIDLTPGAYVIGAGRGEDAPDVTATIEVGRGKTEASLRLGEVESKRFLVVRCSGPNGTPLLGVEFSSIVDQGEASRSGGLDAIERPGGEYWLALAKLMREKEWTAETKLRLVATARGYGKVEGALTLATRELHLEFQAACDLVVVVTGDLSGGYAVSIDAATKKVESELERAMSMNRRNNTQVRVDGEGRAVLTSLQPGTYQVSLTQSGNERSSSSPLVTTEVVLRAGSQTITMAAPVLYELVVHAPELVQGARFMLQAVAEGSSPRGGNQVELGADLRARFKRVTAGEYTLMTWGQTNGSMRVTVPSGEVLFAVEKPNALRVTGVVPGRLAARAGLLDGDLVLSVSGRAVDGPMSEQRIHMDVQGGTSLLRVLRGGTELELTLGPATTEQARSEIGARFNPMTR